jgi:hypothetical protein
VVEDEEHLGSCGKARGAVLCDLHGGAEDLGISEQRCREGVAFEPIRRGSGPSLATERVGQGDTSSVPARGHLTERTHPFGFGAGAKEAVVDPGAISDPSLVR